MNTEQPSKKRGDEEELKDPTHTEILATKPRLEVFETEDIPEMKKFIFEYDEKCVSEIGFFYLESKFSNAVCK